MRRRPALAALLLLVAAFFAPVLVPGDVVFPHDNEIEVGLPERHPPSAISNRKFSDHSSVFVPELHHHLRAPRESWLSLWNPHVQLGRPTTQISGLSKAYLPAHVLSLLTDDAFRLYTWLAILTVFLTALFGFFFLEELGLGPAACAAGSAGIALSVYSCYWLTFLMFLSGTCWTLCLGWLIARWCRKPSLAVGAGVAFAFHALLLSGYPQQIVVNAWGLVFFTMWRLLRDGRAVRASAARGLGLLAAGLIGLGSVAPVYADLLLLARRSARLDAAPEFFLAVIPKIESLGDLNFFVSQLFDASWTGNPIESPYPFRFFKGICATPVLGGLALLAGLDGGWRRSWGFALFAATCLLASFWPPAYLIAVEHLGLGLSRFVPFGGVMIPIGVLAAMAIDRVLKSGPRMPWLALGLVALPLVSLIVAQGHMGLSLASPYPLVGIAFFVGLGTFLWTRRPLVLGVLVVASVFHYGYRLLLVRPEEAIAVESPLVDAVRAATSDGSRFAWVHEGPRILPANEEVLLGLSSIHAYDPLSSQSYQDWVLEVSTEGARTLGRRFERIADDSKLGGVAFGWSGVGILVSPAPIREAVARKVGQVGSISLYQPRTPPLLLAQIPLRPATGNVDGRIRLEGAIGSIPRLPAERLPGSDEHARFRLTPSGEPTLLWISQQFHPHWTARRGSEELATVSVNDFYQGVAVPAGTSEVDLEFRPWSRWSWVPQLAFAVVGAAFLARRFTGAARTAHSA